MVVLEVTQRCLHLWVSNNTMQTNTWKYGLTQMFRGNLGNHTISFPKQTIGKKKKQKLYACILAIQHKGLCDDPLLPPVFNSWSGSISRKEWTVIHGHLVIQCSQASLNFLLNRREFGLLKRHFVCAISSNIKAIYLGRIRTDLDANTDCSCIELWKSFTYADVTMQNLNSSQSVPVRNYHKMMKWFQGLYHYWCKSL